MRGPDTQAVSDQPALQLGERIYRGPWRAVFAVAVLLLLAGAYWPVAIDDSYISAAYAYEWAERGELSWPGEARLEGYSNFAWVALQALALRIGGPLADLPWLTKLVSLLCSVGAVLLLERRLPRNAGGTLVLAAWLLWTPTAIWSVMALETMCFALVCAWGYDSALRGHVRRAAAGALLATLVRSDGSGWALLILVAAALTMRAAGTSSASEAGQDELGPDETVGEAGQDELGLDETVGEAGQDELGLDGASSEQAGPDNPGSVQRRGWLWLGASVALMLGYHAMRVTYFGVLLPAPALLKGGLGVFGPVQLLFEAMAALGLMVALSGLRIDDSARRRRWAWLAPLLLSVATLLSINGDWMGTGRLLLPGVLCCLVARARFGSWQASRLRMRLGVAAVLVASLLQPQFLQLPSWRKWSPRYHEGLDTPLPSVLAWLVEHTPADGVIQSADIGILGHIPRARVRDSRGLVSPLFLRARRSQDWSEVVALYPSAKCPDVLVVSRFLPAMLLDLLDEPTPLAPHPGLDPWMAQLDNDVLARYPHPIDLRAPVSGGLQNGWLSAHRFHLAAPAELAPAPVRAARWKALRTRFPSQPFLAEQYKRAEQQLSAKQ